MKRWWLVGALLVSVGMNLGLLASRVPDRRAQDEPRPALRAEEATRLPERVAVRVRRMADELELRGAEREAFFDLQRTFFRRAVTARRRVMRAQGELKRALAAPEVDQERLDAILVELAEARVDLDRAFVHNLLAARELLEPEQEREFLRFLKRLRQQHG